jgi:hypothetical protein
MYAVVGDFCCSMLQGGCQCKQQAKGASSRRYADPEHHPLLFQCLSGLLFYQKARLLLVTGTVTIHVMDN